MKMISHLLTKRQKTRNEKKPSLPPERHCATSFSTVILVLPRMPILTGRTPGSMHPLLAVISYRGYGGVGSSGSVSSCNRESEHTPTQLTNALTPRPSQPHRTSRGRVHQDRPQLQLYVLIRAVQVHLHGEVRTVCLRTGRQIRSRSMRLSHR